MHVITLVLILSVYSVLDFRDSRRGVCASKVLRYILASSSSVNIKVNIYIVLTFLHTISASIEKKVIALCYFSSPIS